MAVDPIQTPIGLLLVFFLPGYFLTKTLWPGEEDLDREYNAIYVLTLAMALSIALSILLGLLLASLPPVKDPATGKLIGYFRAPYIQILFAVTTGVLFSTAWYRGAFPWMVRLHPSLLRVPAAARGGAKTTDRAQLDTIVLDVQAAGREREQLRREIRDLQRKVHRESGEARRTYVQRKESKLKDLRTVQKRIGELEERRSVLLADGKA